MKLRQEYPFYLRATIILVGFCTLITILYTGQGILVPLVFATIIAIVLSPVVNLLVRKKMNRVLAISTTLVLVILVTILVLLILSSQIMQLSDSWPNLSHNFKQFINDGVIWTSGNFHISTHKINGWIAEKNSEYIKDYSSEIGQTIMNTGSVMVVIILIPVYIFMILFYQPLLLEFIHKIFNTNRHADVNEVLSAAKKIIQSYLVGLLLEASIIAILNSTCLLLLGVDYAILLGVIGAMVNVIPYLGGIIAVALPMLVAFANNSPATVLLVLISYVFIQFIDNHYIIPKVVASKVKVNALVSIVVVLAGGALWGIPGMFLSIPLTAIIKVIFDHTDGLKPWGYLLGDIMPSAAQNRSSKPIINKQ